MEPYAQWAAHERYVLGLAGGLPAELCSHSPRSTAQHLVAEVPNLHLRETSKPIQTDVCGQCAGMNLSIQRIQDFRTNEGRCDQLVVG